MKNWWKHETEDRVPLLSQSIDILFGGFLKMISAQHSSNNGKKLPKNPLSMVIFWIKIRRSYRDFSSQGNPARESWTWSYPYFNEKGRFALVENTITLAFSILTKFDIKFLEKLGDFIAGHLKNWITIRCFSIQEVSVLWVDFK